MAHLAPSRAEYGAALWRKSKVYGAEREATLRKRKATVRTFRADGGADYGPSLRRAKDGRLVAWGGAAQIDVVSRDDPAAGERRRLVRGARRRDALADLFERGVITKRMRDAAEQFLEDLSIASGSRSGDLLSMPTISGPRSGLPERQVAAIVRVNTVIRVLGFGRGSIVWHVVFDNAPLHAFETRHRLRSGRATELLRASLDTLDGHYCALGLVGR